MPSMPEAELRPAATVVLLREGVTGLEVLLLRRNSELAFYGGAWVFPGGRIDASDAHDAFAQVPLSPLDAARRAAVREAREEANLVLAPGTLLHFAQWVTPPGRTRRFDTAFFAAHAQAGEHEVQVDRAEIDAHRWLTPHEAMQARERREIELPPPTFVTLSLLAHHGNVEAAMRALKGLAVRHYAPRPCTHDAGLIHLYAGDAGFETRDPNVTGPRHRLVVEGERWFYDGSAYP
jgi:8-oxo-dGTP pyrophosphatase MutT (NUDIX family)